MKSKLESNTFAKILFIALASIAILFVVIGLFLPNTWEINTSIVIAASKERIESSAKICQWHGKMTFENIGNQTKVTWTEHSNLGNHILHKWMALVIRPTMANEMSSCLMHIKETSEDPYY